MSSLCKIFRPGCKANTVTVFALPVGAVAGLHSQKSVYCSPLVCSECMSESVGKTIRPAKGVSDEASKVCFLGLIVVVWGEHEKLSRCSSCNYF